MIQVCSRCGTRWNVRDRQRQWCPRCQGALLPPSGYAPGSEWGDRSAGSAPGGQQTPPRLPAGYRWIAVRPGAPPPQRRGRRPLGPTPRYTSVPRWGLVEHFQPVAPQTEPVRSGPSARMVRGFLLVATVLFGVAALLFVLRYALLLINRSMLLNPWLADGVAVLGVVAAALALFALIGVAVVLTNWLVARRAATFDQFGQPDPRSARALRLGCLVPFVNLLWAPVFLIDLARIEFRLSALRRMIVVWWVLWVVCTVVSVFAFATSFTDNPQGVADNTVTTTIAFLLTTAVLLLTRRIYLGFESAPVERSVRRWVVVADEPPATPSPRPEPDATTESAVAVEPAGRHPAA
jgi:hypothetical protein